MLRLLIVDDEEIITEALFDVFSRMAPEELDVYKVYSGKEALEWLSRTRIDIVLTDIRMPGMSGLELSKKIQTFWPRCRIIFLTGYNDFDYAYEAVQIPNVRYLLKTEGYTKVTEVVQQVMDEIQKDHIQSSLIEKTKENLQLYEVMSQSEYLRFFLQNSNAIKESEHELVYDFKRLNIRLHPTEDVLLVLGRVKEQEKMSFLKLTEDFNEVQFIWHSYFDEKMNSTAVLDRFGDFLWFLQPEDDSDEQFSTHLIKYVEGTLELIQDACQESVNISLSFTLSGNPLKWLEVTNQYERLRLLQQVKVDEQIASIQVDHPVQKQDNELRTTVILESTIDILERHLEIGRKEDFREVFLNIQKQTLSSSIPIEKVYEIYYSISLMLLSYVNKMDIEDKINYTQKLMRLDKFQSLEDAFNYLIQVADIIFNTRTTEEVNRSQLVVEKICQYIQDHVGENLSLVKLAEIHYFNPTYLSRFFKQEMGMNISEYIDQYRVIKAKELFANGELKVREIANLVGYESSHSFTRFFKRATGMTPQEYRDSIFLE